MKSIADLKIKYLAWLNQHCSQKPLVYFRVTFAAVWLVYDVLDLWLGGTQSSFWGVVDPAVHLQITLAQIVLIVCEVGLITGWMPSVLMFTAFIARAFEAWCFPVNDFLYFCVVALLFSFADSVYDPNRPERPRWPRDVLMFQTGWIYFCTALLKLNPAFLSGGDFFVRQNYLAALFGWPYPDFYLKIISGLSGNSVLAWMGVAGEFSMSILCFAWLKYPARRRYLRPALIVGVIAIHGFAAVTLNVFFFGASMIAQIVCLTRE
jgi:hypothetical protein